jgi:oligopeptide transport system ATP-binding protein
VALLEAHHIFKAFPIEGGVLKRRIGTVQALADVSIAIDPGEVLALVGGSGCGKSTLARIIAGLLEADSGQLIWDGRPLESFSRLERAHRVQMIFQDPYASLNPKLSIRTQLEEVVRISAVMTSDPTSAIEGKGERGDRPPGWRSPRTDVAERCASLLQCVGLSTDALAHYPFQFSGGQRQRIAIARALAMRPQLLIADEPLSALDVTTQAQMIDLLRRLRASQGLALLFITHDLAVAAELADRVVVLKEGRVVEEGSAGQVLSSPRHPYAQALLEAVPRI